MSNSLLCLLIGVAIGVWGVPLLLGLFNGVRKSQ